MVVLFLFSNPYAFCIIFFFYYTGLDCQYNSEKKRLKRHPCYLLNFTINVYLFIKYGFKKKQIFTYILCQFKEAPHHSGCRSTEESVTVGPNLPIYSCHPRIISHGAPFHPQKGFSLDNELYSPSNRGGDRLW